MYSGSLNCCENRFFMFNLFLTHLSGRWVSFCESWTYLFFFFFASCKSFFSIHGYTVPYKTRFSVHVTNTHVENINTYSEIQFKNKLFRKKMIVGSLLRNKLWENCWRSWILWGVKGKEGKLGRAKRIFKKVTWMVLTYIERDYRSKSVGLRNQRKGQTLGQPSFLCPSSTLMEECSLAGHIESPKVTE